MPQPIEMFVAVFEAVMKLPAVVVDTDAPCAEVETTASTFTRGHTPWNCTQPMFLSVTPPFATITPETSRPLLDVGASRVCHTAPMTRILAEVDGAAEKG